MSIFFRKLALLLLPFMFLGFYAEYELRQVDNGYSRKKADLEQILDSIEVLAMGSSHTLYGIDPDQFRDRTFNQAYVSQSLYYDWKLLDTYLDRMPRLKAVIVPISYFSLDSNLALSAEKWRGYFYEDYYGIPIEGDSAQRLQSWLDPKRYSMVALYGIPRTFKHFRRGFNLDDVAGQQHNGWMKKDSVVTIEDEVGRKRVALHESMMSDDARTKNMDYLRLMLSRLQMRKVRLLLVTPPVLPAYSGHVDSLRLQSLQQTMASFCVENGCDYLDAFTDSRFTANDFFDSDHLNSNGARKFSQILNNALLKEVVSRGEE